MSAIFHHRVSPFVQVHHWHRARRSSWLRTAGAFALGAVCAALLFKQPGDTSGFVNPDTDGTAISVLRSSDAAPPAPKVRGRRHLRVSPEDVAKASTPVDAAAKSGAAVKSHAAKPDVAKSDAAPSRSQPPASAVNTAQAQPVPAGEQAAPVPMPPVDPQSAARGQDDAKAATAAEEKAKEAKKARLAKRARHERRAAARRQHRDRLARGYERLPDGRVLVYRDVASERRDDGPPPGYRPFEPLFSGHSRWFDFSRIY